MEWLKRVVNSTAAQVFALLATILGVVLVVIKPLRDAVADAYDDKWVLPAILGAALILMVVGMVWRPRRVRVITKDDDLAHELKRTVESAEKYLYCVGSRSRDQIYMDAILDRVRTHAALEHTRVLFGHPFHAPMKAHLVDLDVVRQASPSRIKISMLSRWGDPEQSFCASEKRAVIVTPALGRLGRYESAIVVTQKDQVEAVVKYASDLLGVSDELSTTAAIAALETTHTQSVERG